MQKESMSINDVLASSRPARHLGIIRVSATALDELVSIDQTDTQGKLRDTGIFAQLHEKMLLPASYSVFGMFYRPLQHSWEICVESSDLPALEEYCDPPMVIPTYRRIYPENGTSYTELKEIRIERWVEIVSNDRRTD